MSASEITNKPPLVAKLLPMLSRGGEAHCFHAHHLPLPFRVLLGSVDSQRHLSLVQFKDSLETVSGRIVRAVFLVLFSSSRC